ncbi:hypothetical protein B0O99DRAFT_688840 [Bisporella sp. PMI_857]|nr:hypothetical protein B0O99DRAFT_688840 [Bisporella sp. PMI_857]
MSSLEEPASLEEGESSFQPSPLPPLFSQKHTNVTTYYRTSIVFRIINMLVCFDPILACDPLLGFALAPLPTKKLLWEASTEWQWGYEYLSAREETIYGLRMDGELVCTEQFRQESRSTANWERWRLEMDGIGGRGYGRFDFALGFRWVDGTGYIQG